MEYIICIYCLSDSSLVREHVISVAYLGHRSYDKTIQWIVPACNICNSFAGEKLFFSIPEKAAYIAKRYKSRYRKVLRIPNWTPEELDEVDYKLRGLIEEGLIAKTLIKRRIQYLEIVASYATDYLRPKWAEALYLEWKEAQLLEPPKKRREKKHIEKN